MRGGHDQADIVLDACCLLNLYASRHMAEILNASTMRFAASTRTLSEALYVYRGGGGEDAYERELVDLSDIVQQGLLDILSLSTEEEYATFVNLATVLDDGEAEVCALAINRGLAVATDERKVLTLSSRPHPSVSIFTTPAIVEQWADAVGIPEPILRRALLDIEMRGCFIPPKSDARQTWWLSITRER